MNFCLIFTLYIVFHSFVFSLYSAEEKEHLKASSVSGSSAVAAAPVTFSSKLMGIEIETSTIKIKSPTSDKLGFYFNNATNGELVWVLEEDTLDATFRDSAGFEGFDQNVEIKTHPAKGFLLAEIRNIIEDMENTIKYLYRHALSAALDVTSHFLEEMHHPKYRILPKISTQAHFLIKSKILPAEELIIKPQITYQLSLEEIPRVFRRLGELKHLGINFFLHDLSGAPLEITSSESILSKLPEGPFKKLARGITRNKDLGEPLRRYFNEHIGPHFTSLPESRVKGLITLFLYYWYELFNDKRIKGPEPGLKQFLGVMSRIPLSQLYESLNRLEKEAFKIFIRPHLAFGVSHKLRPYINEDDDEVDGPINLAEWFESIVDESHVTTGKRDLLSPPPQMVEHSMGILDINSNANGVALIEVRGYSNLKHKDKNITIDRIREFGIDESGWFFGY